VKGGGWAVRSTAVAARSIVRQVAWLAANRVARCRRHSEANPVATARRYVKKNQEAGNEEHKTMVVFTEEEQGERFGEPARSQRMPSTEVPVSVPVNGAVGRPVVLGTSSCAERVVREVR